MRHCIGELRLKSLTHSQGNKHARQLFNHGPSGLINAPVLDVPRGNRNHRSSGENEQMNTKNAIFINAQAAINFMNKVKEALGGERVRSIDTKPVFRRGAMQGYLVFLNGLPVLEDDMPKLMGV